MIKTYSSVFNLYKEQSKKASLRMKVITFASVILLLLFSISYAAVHAINNNMAIENNINTSSSDNVNNRKILDAKAEKLSMAATTHPHVTIEKQIVEHISPRPFINDLRGESPSGFSPSFVLPTTPAYPKFPNHRNPNQPHNIQDIIHYLSENGRKQKEVLREDHRQFPFPYQSEKDKFKLRGIIQSPTRTRFTKQYFPQDPFFAFKPQDPSEINLLAPTSFRFAPSILTSTTNRNRQQLLHDTENVVTNPEGEGFKKPLSLTLNIYPTSGENEFGNGENRIRFQGPGITPRYRYSPFLGGLQRNRNVARPGRMVVRLNVFPGNSEVFTSQEEDNTERKLQVRN